MRKKQFISELKVGDQVDDIFAVKFRKSPRKYQNGYWFGIRISDKTDEITAKYWSQSGNVEDVNKVYNSFKKGDVIHIIGKVSQYNDRLEISINPPYGKIEKVESFDSDDFVEKTDKNIDEMYHHLLKFVDSVTEPHLKEILTSFFTTDNEFISEFKKAPAAMHLHQNIIGGLLEHTINVVRICDTIADVYPELDRDMLITGALLHDIGKIREFEVTTSIDVSEEGMLRGHIIIGEEMVRKKMEKLNIPRLLQLKLSHMMLAQHGKQENGSPKAPQMPEAVALYYADDCDSKVNQYLKLKKEAKTEDPWTYSKRLGHVYLK